MTTTNEITDAQARRNVGVNIKRLLAEQEHTLYWLATELEMSFGTLYPIADGEVNCRRATLRKIANALGVTPDDLEETPPIRPEKPRRKNSRKSA